MSRDVQRYATSLKLSLTAQQKRRVAALLGGEVSRISQEELDRIAHLTSKDRRSTG
jgi:hypothetical protein